MTPWRDLTDAQIAEITRRTYRRYRRPFGKSIAAVVATRRAARLRAQRFAAGASDVEVENAVLMQAVRHIEAGMPVGSAWDEAEKYRAQLAREGSK